MSTVGRNRSSSGRHLLHDDDFVTFDVAFDEVDAREVAEQLAAAPHLGGELHVGLGARLHHEILSRAEVAARADGGVAHADFALGGAERIGQDVDVADAAQVACSSTDRIGATGSTA